MIENMSEKTTDIYKIEVLRSIREIEDYRPLWEQMQAKENRPAINADIDRYLSVLKAIGDGVKPYVMLFSRNGQPEAIVIGRIESRRLNLKLGYKTLFNPSLNCLTIIHKGILGQPDNDLSQLIIGELMKMLSRGEVDLASFNHLSTESHLYKLSRKMPGFLCRGNFPRTEPHWVMSIPETADQLYEHFSPRNRSNLRRLTRRLEKAYPGQVEVRTYTTEDELEDAINVMGRVSAKTYQSGLDCGFVDAKYNLTMLKMAASRGWLKACVLFIQGEPCAFELAFRYCQTYFGLHTGFDPKWKQYRIGTVLFLRFLESICGDSAVDRFDFGFGDAEYKRSYGDKQWQEASVYIFAPRAYPVAINMLQSAVTGLSFAMNRFLEKAGFAGWLKRRWRNLLQSRPPNSNN